MAVYHTLDPVCFSGRPLGGVVPKHPHSAGVPGVGSSEPRGAPGLAQEASLYALYLDVWRQHEGIYSCNIVYTLYISSFGVNMKVYTVYSSNCVCLFVRRRRWRTWLRIVTWGSSSGDRWSPTPDPCVPPAVWWDDTHQHSIPYFITRRARYRVQIWVFSV